MPRAERLLPQLKSHPLTTRREAFRAPERSRVLERVDDDPIWSLVCFLIAKPLRRGGVTVALLRASVAEPATLAYP
jgi:hypothetical protein